MKTPCYARVVVNLPQLPGDCFYDYLLPGEEEWEPSPGARLLVPFGGRKAEAVLWKKTTETECPEKVRPVLAVLDEEPLLSQFQLDLIDWMAGRFFCRRMDLLQLFFPPGLKVATEKCWQRLVGMKEIEDFLNNLPLPDNTRRNFWAKVQGLTGEPTPLPALEREEYQLLNRLLRAGYVKTGWFPKKSAAGFRKVKTYKVKTGEPGIKLTPKQQQVFRYLKAQEGRAVPAGEILAAAGVTDSVLRALVKKGIIECSWQKVSRNPFSGMPEKTLSLPSLNEDQRKALSLIFSALEGEKPAAFLLHGVTGSGKTEVYLRAIEETLKRGKGAYYLVPEISLTPQTVERVRSRFGDTVAVFHSGLGLGERFEQWWRVKRGEVKVVVGARSALFAPLAEPGLIILDEEHEYTYKQEETPRYHAREVAKEICQRVNGVLILGSATPSLESYREAQTGKLVRITLPRRVLGRAMPEIKLVDLREEFKAKRLSVLSPLLREEISRRLDREEQVILLLNRRGYATFIICCECGHVLKCPSCDVTLTYHRPNLLLCHYCGLRKRPPDTCPRCRGHHVRYAGRGTQRLEEELKRLYPGSRVVRMDVDTTGRKGRHEEIYQELVRGEIDILVGTQMVAKGLDLPRVTLVGIVNADTALNLPDFRCAERTHQLLTQAAGRAGRGEKTGTVIIQTFNPGHYSISCLRHGDEEGFYRRELRFREAGKYPPFTYLVRLVYSGVKADAVALAAREITNEIKKELARAGQEFPEAPKTEVIGPQPAIIAKIQDRYRWHTLLKAPDLKPLSLLLPRVLEQHRKKARDVRVIVDENPYSML